MNAPASNWRIGLPLSVATSICWGITPLLLKGLLAELDPMTLAWCRQVGCGLLIVGFFLWRRDISWQALRSRRVLGLVAICTFGMTANTLLFNIGLEYASPSTTQVMGQLGPILLLIGAVFIFKESFTGQQWLGSAITILGLGLFFHDHVADLLHMSSFGFGMLMLLIAPLFWTAYALAQKCLTGQLGTQQVLMISYLVGVVVLLPLSALPRVALLSAGGWFLLAGVIAAFVLSYVALGTAMARWEASRVSAMITLTPLFTLGFGHVVAVFFPSYLAVEHHDLLSWGGAVLVVAGSCLAALTRRRYPVAA